MDPPWWRPLFAGEHGLRLAFEVEVGIAADVDGDAFDGAASEGVRVRARVVVGDWFCTVFPDVEALAGDEHRLYLFEGLRMTGDNFDRLHLASHRFDEPRALDLIASCDTVVAGHGYAASGPDVLLGGLNEGLKREIAQALAKTGFSCLTDGHRFPGRDPRNICNRGRSGEGVQIELSEDLRKAGNWPLLAAAVRNVLQDLVGH